MSFENLKRDLNTYDGRSDLNLDEMLALYRSLEADINRMTHSSMDKYELSEQECQSDTLISSLAWLGNLFNGIYTRNQAAVDANSGRIIRRFLESARNSAKSLSAQRDELLRQVEEEKALKEKNARMEAELEELRLQTSDAQLARNRYQQLQAQCDQEREKLKAMVPFDMETAQRELEDIQNQIEEAKRQKARAQAEFESKKMEADSEKREQELQIQHWQERMASLEDTGGTLQQEAEEKKMAADAKAAEIAALQANLDEINQMLSERHAQYAFLRSQIADQEAARESDKQTLTELQVELAKTQESNDSFRSKFMLPVEESLEQARLESQTMEAQRAEYLEQLKALTGRIQELQENLPNLKNQIDAQSSNCQAAELNLSRSMATLEGLEAEIAARETEKRAADATILTLEEKLLSVNTEVSTLQLQTMPELNRQMEQKEQEKAELDTQLLQLNEVLSALQQDVTQKTEEVNAQTAQKEERQAALRKLGADLDDLIKTNQSLKTSLEEQNPEQAKAELVSANQALLAQIEAVDQIKTELAQKLEELQKLTNDRTKLTENLDRTSFDLQSLEQECEALTERVRYLRSPDCQAKLDSLKKRKNFLEDVAYSLKTLADRLPKDCVCRSESEIIQATVTDLKNRMNLLQEQIRKVQSYYKENV